MLRQWILVLVLLLPISVVAQDVIATNTVASTIENEFVPGTTEKKKPERPIPKGQWDYLTKLWLGRSCVGEAGFQAVEECIGIAWTIATRSKETRTRFMRMLQGYSQAIQSHERHRRPWIFELHYDGEQPSTWPENLSWRFHKKLWFKILDELDKWAKGKRENPVEGANHFGGEMDTPGFAWIVVEPKGDVPFRNIFYRQVRSESSTK